MDPIVSIWLELLMEWAFFVHIVVFYFFHIELKYLEKNYFK